VQINENNTFGQSLLAPRESAELQAEDVAAESTSSPSAVVLLERPVQQTISPDASVEQYVVGGANLAPSIIIMSDISTAAPSFVTEPATQEGTSESGGRTDSTYGDILHMVDPSDRTWRPA